MATTYHQLGMLAQDRGHYDEAERRYAQSLTIFEQLGDQACMATIYSQLGLLGAVRGQIAEVILLHLKALQIRIRLGVPQVRIDLQVLHSIRARLGVDEFTRQAANHLDDGSLATLAELLDMYPSPDDP
jgi:tetratricopeptide (TPR) repeat protein